ncbi:MAG TPA: cytochrome c [Vicinamibacterales bacterium]|nr:cytochrome c [Vicinamibacterales bacterium]
MRVFALGFVPAAVMLCASVMSAQSAPPPGKAPFDRVCATCHGQNAEGNQGPRLAGIEIDFDEFLAKVRHGGGEMPAIAKSQITDEEVKQVLEYLESL